jgi:hypothetical protein
LHITLDYFTRSLAKAKAEPGKNGMSKATFMLNMVSKEMLEEAGEIPPEIISFYLDQLAAVVHWSATGQFVPEMPLPDDFPYHPMNAPQAAPETVDEKVRELE